MKFPFLFPSWWVKMQGWQQKCTSWTAIINDLGERDGNLPPLLLSDRAGKIEIMLHPMAFMTSSLTRTVKKKVSIQARDFNICVPIMAMVRLPCWICLRSLVYCILLPFLLQKVRRLYLKRECEGRSQVRWNELEWARWYSVEYGFWNR